MSEAGECCTKCKAPLGRSGKCPRLCEPVKPAIYVGPAVIGSGTHLGNIARSDTPGWIG